MTASIQNVLQALAVAAVLYFAATVNSLQATLIKLEASVQQLQKQQAQNDEATKEARQRMFRKLDELDK